MSTKKKPAPANRAITIGMYNVGFGDAFLVRIPDGTGGERRILFDCGMHMGGPGPTPIAEVAKRIVDDVTENGKARIDVVVGTHRHADHVSGFQQKIWSKVEVSEVWLPWTEDPNDAHAQRILESQSKRSLALVQHITARARKDEAFRAAAAKSGLMEIAQNNLKNAPAMKTLHEGFAGGTAKRFFLPSNKNERPRSFTTDVLPGVKVHVLGPSKDDAVIANLVNEEEKLFRISQSALSDKTEPPFKPRWVIPTTTINTDPTLEQLRLDAKTLKNISEIGDGSELAAAASTDNQINNTSLMLLFEIGNAVLLFPGDAQWGTWQAALNDPEWQPLLKKVTFLKVGHHGSENATPKTFVEKYLGDRYLALVSTRQTKMWAHVPKPSLITLVSGPKLDRLARSDKPTEAPASFTTEGTIYTEVKVEF